MVVSSHDVTMAVLDLDELRIDDTYQRPLRIQWVEAQTEQFDPLLVGSLFVNRRDNGELYVIDGQQRLALLREVGFDTANVVLTDGLTQAEEAELFVGINKRRIRVSPWNAFRARLVAREDRARAIDVLVANTGFMLGGTTDDRDVIGAIVAVETAYDYTGAGLDTAGTALANALDALRKSWRGRKRGLDGNVIRGLSRMFAMYGTDVKTGVLRDVMDEHTPSQVITTVHERQRMMHGHSAGYEVAVVLTEAYNKAVEKGDRLDVKLLAAKMTRRIESD